MKLTTNLTFKITGCILLVISLVTISLNLYKSPYAQIANDLITILGSLYGTLFIYLNIIFNRELSPKKGGLYLACAGAFISLCFWQIEIAPLADIAIFLSVATLPIYLIPFVLQFFTSTIISDFFHINERYQNGETLVMGIISTITTVLFFYIIGYFNAKNHHQKNIENTQLKIDTRLPEIDKLKKQQFDLENYSFSGVFLIGGIINLFGFMFYGISHPIPHGPGLTGFGEAMELLYNRMFTNLILFLIILSIAIILATLKKDYWYKYLVASFIATSLWTILVLWLDYLSLFTMVICIYPYIKYIDRGKKIAILEAEKNIPTN